TVTMVVTGLEILADAQPFPFVKGSYFLGVVTLETQRRDNTLKTRALVLQLSDMLAPFSIFTMGVCGRIRSLMKQIKQDIKEVGNLVDTYHKHSLTSKFFFSGKYQGQFKDAGDIVFALQIHITVGIDEIREQVRNSNTLLVKLIKIVEYNSPGEQGWERSLKNLGGRNKVLANDELLTTFAQEIEDSQSSESTAKTTPKEKGEKGNDADKDKPTDPKSTGKADDSKTKSGKDASNVLSLLERRELRMPLQEIIDSNFALYEGKLESQVQLLSKAVTQSKQEILQHLESGAHEKISHHYIRRVWKDMGWRSNVKSRQFVLAMHDFYADRYARAFMLRRRASTENGPSLQTPVDGGDQSPTTHAQVDISDADMAPGDIEETLADRWCLQYLDITHAYPIMEAIDDDDSGYIRISEINDFTSSTPKGWTLLQWFAYWGGGWKQQSSVYARSINEIIVLIRRKSHDVLVENNQFAINYVKQLMWSSTIAKMTWAVTMNTPATSESPLDKLVARSMEYKEEQLERALRRVHYNVDAPDSLVLISGPGRIEKDIFAIIFLILRHHYLIFLRATKVWIDEREFQVATNTVANIVKAITDRVNILSTSYRQQGLDEQIQLSRFHGGIYRFVPDSKNEQKIEWRGLDDGPFSELKEKISSSEQNLELRYGEWSLDLHSYSNPPAPNVLPGEVSDEGKDDGEDDESDDDDSRASNAANIEEIMAQANSSAFSLLKISDSSPDFGKHMKDVIHGLEAIAMKSGPFSFINGTVKRVKRVLASELKKEKVNPRIKELLRGLVSIISPLLKLYFWKDAGEATETGASFGGRLSDLLHHILFDIRDAEKAIETLTTQAEKAVNNNPADNPSPISELATLDSVINRLHVRRCDIEFCLDLHNEKGFRRLLVAQKIVIRDIQEQRRRLSPAYLRRRQAVRKLFINLTAKSPVRELASRILSDTERAELTAIISEVPKVDLARWDSLSRLQRRRENVHANIGCDGCGTCPLVGHRYTCLTCYDFDLCVNCERKVHSPEPGTMPMEIQNHLPSHPLMKVCRQVWAPDEVDDYDWKADEKPSEERGNGDDSAAEDDEVSEDAEPRSANLTTDGAAGNEGMYSYSEHSSAKLTGSKQVKLMSNRMTTHRSPQ
ncbi:uncharacterized protein EI90DRAFT_3034423, partial [Cantharellus anzutake]|uniref:uncharacterized protein n=1 Tax=Cantharellus anzutake TaxID=1750568 RepID=UPI001907E946